MRKLCVGTFLTFVLGTPMAQTITFATWNLAWHRSEALTEIEYNKCKAISKTDREQLDELHIFKWECKSPAQIAEMRQIAEKLNADVIAVQEVESAEALMQIWPKEQFNFFVNMKSPWIQRTGFVVRKGIPAVVGSLVDVRELGDAFNGDHARHGAEIALSIRGVNIQLMSVHLKSGCFDQSLDSGYATKRDRAKGVVTCEVLKNQIPALESWLDRKLKAGMNAMIIGDFNRRFDARIEFERDPKKSVFADLSDGTPNGADLFRPTYRFQAPQECRGGGSPWLIDHALLSTGLKQNYEKSSIHELPVPLKGSDHCPMSFKMNF